MGARAGPGGAASIAGRRLGDGRAVELLVADGRVLEARDAGTGGSGPYLAPGLVDLQVNGYGGIDFNGPPLAEGDGAGDGVARATRLLWAEGVTSFLPTIITNDAASIERNLGRIAAARDADPLVAASIPGIHLEGPFVSPLDGPRGAHPAEHVRAPDWELFRRWQDAARGGIRLVTLSPEWPESVSFIARCVESGVRVAIGHTAASPERIREAVVAGASMSTHLGNGSFVTLPRLSNYIWQQLAEDGLRASLIADGFHIPLAPLKVFLRAKGERAFLVSDAVYLAGMPPGPYRTHIGGRVVLSPEGRLSLADNPELLAGSVRTILAGVNHLANSGLAPPAEAWAMASERPARYLSPDEPAGLEPGARADFLLVEAEEGRFAVIETYKSGELVYERS